MQEMKGFIIVVGWLMAPVINLVVNIIYLVNLYTKRIPEGLIPRWITGFNLVVQLLQLIIIPLT